MVAEASQLYRTLITGFGGPGSRGQVMRLLLSLCAASFTCLMHASAAQAAPHDMVASDGGTVEPVPFPAPRRVNGHEGRTPGDPEVQWQPALTRYGREPGHVPPEILEAEKHLSPPPVGDTGPQRAGGAATDAVIGRDRRQRVYTNLYPARAVVFITFEGFRCSGFLIGADIVATAGHCVHEGSGGRWYDVGSYQIYPGRNGALAPYGSCTAARLFSVRGWTDGGLHTHDYGAIKLNCRVGNNVGWFGWWWTGDSTLHQPVTVQGYPSDQPNATQWLSADKSRCNSTHKVFYLADTAGGGSGGPVWQDRNGAIAFGIHAYGRFGDGCNAANNNGVRITEVVSRNLLAWRAAPR